MSTDNFVPILGIPCSLTNPAARIAFHDVLFAIMEGHPEDFARILRLVTEVVPITPELRDEGTEGAWETKVFLETEDPETWGRGFDETPGRILIDEDLQPLRLLALFAHELGHTCTGEDDLEFTHAPSDEWASELSADRFAYKWRFGEAIAVQQKLRDRWHHCGGPGEVIECGEPPRKYRINHQLQFVRVEA